MCEPCQVWKEAAISILGYVLERFLYITNRIRGDIVSYIALYRKYRPDSFESIVSQDHIIDILKSQIINDKVSHAYIFSGSRGTGKTTAAKVFAKAVNCLNRNGAEPCNECEACKSIISGSTTDVIEMDAASNNSVDNIRGIRQEVMYATTGLKYKVYIIDEVHMLSTSAFNALLKTLEEPPPNVIFILATTEEHKILPTILSRCMRFEFKKIKEEDIINRLKYVLKDNNIEIEEDALKYIAKLSNGGLRDALSILERLIDDKNSEITYSKVESLVGSADKEVLEKLSLAILEYNLEEAINITETIINSGKEIRHICAQLVDVFIEKLKYIVINKTEDKAEISLLRLNYIIKEISKLDSDIRQSVNSDIILKSKIIELCTQIIYSNEQELLEKIEVLQLRIEKLEKTNDKQIIYKEKEDNIKQDRDNQVNVKKIDKDKQEQVAHEKKQEKKDESPKDKQDDYKDKILFKEIEKVKCKIIENDNLQLYSALAGTKVYKCDNCISFETENKFAFGILSKDANKEALHQVIIDTTGKENTIKIEYKQKAMEQSNPFEAHMKEIDMPITMMD